MKEKTNYDRVFKENAVKLSYERGNVASLARELGISPKLLSSWRQQYLRQGDLRFPGAGKRMLSKEEEELLSLRKQLQYKEQELAILKKALSIISRSDR